MAQERILGFNKDGEQKWHEGNHLPQGWFKQDPTKGQKAGDVIEEPIQVDPKGTKYPVVEDKGPQDIVEPPVETHEITEAEMPKNLPMHSDNLQPKLIPDPPAPQVKPEPAPPVELDADGDEPLPPPVETPKVKRKAGRPKKGD